MDASHGNDSQVHSPVDIRNLEVRRGGRRVLPGISLSVAKSAVTGLLGPSGSGKTTLLRAIVGVQVIASGDVEVLGQPAGTPELRRRVAYVTQAPSIYGDLTVRENLHYFARILRVSQQRTDDVIAKVDLRDRADQLVTHLSGGERSRCSLAAALLGDPELLILDEPTVGLDPVLRRDLWSTFHQLARDGVTLVVSTHVMDEADHCDNLIFMQEGRVVAMGAPTELREQTGTNDLEEAFLQLITT